MHINRAAVRKLITKRIKQSYRTSIVITNGRNLLARKSKRNYTLNSQLNFSKKNGHFSHCCVGNLQQNKKKNCFRT